MVGQTNRLVVESERTMISIAEKAVVPAGSWKWTRKEVVRAFSWDEADRFVTDAAPPASSGLPDGAEVFPVSAPAVIQTHP